MSIFDDLGRCVVLTYRRGRVVPLGKMYVPSGILDRSLSGWMSAKTAAGDHDESFHVKLRNKAMTSLASKCLSS